LPKLKGQFWQQSENLRAFKCSGRGSCLGQQEAQLPQRNSASAAHVHLGWLTDRAMRRTPQHRRYTTRL